MGPKEETQWLCAASNKCISRSYERVHALKGGEEYVQKEPYEAQVSEVKTRQSQGAKGEPREYHTHQG